MIPYKRSGRLNLMSGYVTVLTVAVLLVACDARSSRSMTQPISRPLVQSISPPERILFIGNSFTYYNGGVDAHLRELVLAAEPGSSIRIESLTTPSQTVEGHYRSSATLDALHRAPWDLVVVQGASYEPVSRSTLENFRKHVALIAKQIRAEDAEIALFMTWAYRSRPSLVNKLSYGYLSSGNDISALIVPVGLAWERIREDRSVDYLYSDRRHPSLHGTYLAACVFYATLFGKSPIGIAYYGGLSEDEARYLQSVAWDTTRQFFGADLTG